VPLVDKYRPTLEDELIKAKVPDTKPTDKIWPNKRRKLLAKYFGFDVSKMSNEEIEQAIKSKINNFGNH